MERLIELPEDPAATEAFGEWLGRHLGAGDTVGLVGPLGAGKTTLVRGLARGLGCDDPASVCSPTYLLLVHHPGRLPLLHADAYLPEKLAGFLADGGLEELFDRRAVAVVEWADRIRHLVPEPVLWVEFAVLPGAGRRLRLCAAPPGAFAWLGQGPTAGPAGLARPSTAGDLGECR